MGNVLSIRSTNGGGKSTIARRFLQGDQVPLVTYAAPTKKDPDRLKAVPGYVRESKQLGRIGVVGPYSSACGGLDQVCDFETSRRAISWMLDNLECQNVIAEGLLAAGTYGSWGTYSADLTAQGHRYLWCYLQTPLEVCKQRIIARQEAAGVVGKNIKWEQVEGKFAQVVANRLKALEMGEVVYDLPYGGEVEAVIDIMQGGEKAERHRARG